MTVVPPDAKGVVRNGSAVVRSFAPDGEMKWELLGLVFTDTAAVAVVATGDAFFTAEGGSARIAR